MRDIKELLVILLAYYTYANVKGICTTIQVLEANDNISREESNNLMLFLRQNKPSEILHKEHYEHGRNNMLTFWWSVYDNLTDTKKPRIKYLEYLISLQ